MQKNTKERKLNNEGFSLVELLVAIVILSIIVVPLLHSFVTSARTNAKARNTMHATAVAEDVMEMFEAHSLEEMADIYTSEIVEGFVNTADEDESTGIWTYQLRDDSTTSGTYDVVVTVDPTAAKYSTINGTDRVDIQNLAGNLNAVYNEAEDAAQEAYIYFGGGSPTRDIIQNTTRKTEITIDSSKINVTLKNGNKAETVVYLVTASTVYSCDPVYLYPGRASSYPQNGSNYVIFSNEDAVRKQAAQVEDASEIASKLANIIVCLQTRVESSRMSGGRPTVVDSLVVNNPDNVPVNLYVVEQGATASQQELFRDLFAGENYDTWRKNRYGFSLELREAWPGWMPAAGTTERSACRLRTNLIGPDDKTAYIFQNSSMTGAGASTGENYALAQTIMSTTDLTPTQQKDYIYDIEVRVYAKDKITEASPIITMTGTVTE